MAKDTPTVDECLAMGRACACYNLRRASRAVTQVYDAYLEEVGLKATQLTILAVLAHRDPPEPVTTLAEALVLEQSSLSRNLAVLERMGFVAIAKGPTDRRERVPTLTRAGRAALARGYPAWRRAQAALEGALSPSRLDDQMRGLRRLTKTALAVREVHKERS
jgi:DNA-binding MarR family transcriptional regulator